MSVFSLPAIVSQMTLVAEPTTGGPGIDLKTYDIAAQEDDLLNLYEGGLITKLAPGKYIWAAARIHRSIA